MKKNIYKIFLFFVYLSGILAKDAEKFDYIGPTPFSSYDIVLDLPVAQLNNLIDFYLPTSKLVENDKCRDISQRFLLSLLQKELWTLQMFDSWGKFPDGFFFGNFHPVGMYEECTLLEASIELMGSTVHFDGKYCTILFESKQDDPSLSDILNNDYPSARSGLIIGALLQPIPFGYGTCIPSMCTPEDLRISLNEKFSQSDRMENRTVASIHCSGEEDDLDGFDITVVCFVFILIFLVVVTTVIDAFQVKRKWVQPLYSFSFSRNFSAVFSSNRESPDEITCIHGLRAISLIWIMTCHQYVTALGFVANTRDASKYQDPFLAQAVTNGWPSVDTFFCLSGIMLAYKLLPSILEKKKINPIIVFCRRFLRLFPSILMLSMFCATLVRFLGWGPRNYRLKSYALEDCRDYWWTAPLFINNFVNGDGSDNMIHDCLPNCWFTAVLMQLFLITPFMFVPMWINQKYGIIAINSVIVASLIIPITSTAVNEFPPIPLATTTDIELYHDYMTKFFYMPWCRAGPWLVGILAGYIIVKMPSSIPPPKKVHIIIGYVLAIGSGLLVTLCLFNYNHVGDFEEYEVWASTLYAGFSRHLWGVAVSFVVITCHFGHAESVNDILSWKGWRPISRLTFCMYLIHPVVQMWWSSVLLVPTYYSYFYKLFELSGVFFISGLMSIFLTTLVERPFMKLFDYFIGLNKEEEELNLIEDKEEKRNA